MQLHVIYRYHPGENAKRRPAFYSKALALASFLRASGQCDPAPDVVFAHDGPIEEPLREIMGASGTVLAVNGGSARRSYLSVVKLPRLLRWDEGDVVLFCEDDYLYLPEALSELLEAARALPAQWYLTPYTNDWDQDDGLLAVPIPNWRRARSGTSTFGSRVLTIRQDERLLRLCPWSGGAWDTATCLTLQGQAPFTWAQLLQEAKQGGRGNQWPERGLGQARATIRTLVRGAVKLRAHRRPSRRRSLAAPMPNSATHLEAEWLSPGKDWRGLARDTEQWARAALPGLALKEDA